MRAKLRPKEKDRLKTLLYRDSLIEKNIITEHSDTSYTFIDEHDAVLMAMGRYGKEIKKRTKTKMFEFMEWIQTYAEIYYDKEKMEVFWKVEVETHVFDIMSIRQAYKYWKNNVKNR